MVEQKNHFEVHESREYDVNKLIVRISYRDFAQWGLSPNTMDTPVVIRFGDRRIWALAITPLLRGEVERGQIRINQALRRRLSRDPQKIVGQGVAVEPKSGLVSRFWLSIVHLFRCPHPPHLILYEPLVPILALISLFISAAVFHLVRPYAKWLALAAIPLGLIWAILWSHANLSAERSTL
jgi:hypothetical protein